MKQKNSHRYEKLPFAVAPIKVRGKTVGSITYDGWKAGGMIAVLKIHCPVGSAVESAVKQFFRDKEYWYKQTYETGDIKVQIYEITMELSQRIKNPQGLVRKVARILAGLVPEIEENREQLARVKKLAAATLAKWKAEEEAQATTA